MHKPIALAAIAASTATLLGLLGVPPVAAEGAVTSARLAGGDRYATALAISDYTYPGSAEGETHASGAALARGDQFPDALAGVNATPGAILLTPRDELPPGVADFLATRARGRVYLMGQEDVVSSRVQEQVAATGSEPFRLPGRDRYETAFLAMRDGQEYFGGGGQVGGLRTAYLVNGLDPADAVSAGWLSYGMDTPLLLTARDSLPGFTREALMLDDESHDPIEQVVIVGGPNAVADSVVAELQQMRIQVRRVAGPTRQETAIRAFEFSEQELGWVLGHINLARGDDPVDALAASHHAVRERAPILLTVGPDELGESNRQFLRTRARRDGTSPYPESPDFHILGSERAVSAAVVRDAEQAAALSPPPPS